MAQERSPERPRPPAGRGGTENKARRVSHRKELAVVTLGMVAAVSGVGGLLAANPPSWATTNKPVSAAIVSKTAVHHEPVRRAAVQTGHLARGMEEQGVVRRAPRESAGQRHGADGAVARAKIVRNRSKRAARRQQRAVYSAQSQASASASASAVSRGS